MKRVHIIGKEELPCLDPEGGDKNCPLCHNSRAMPIWLFGVIDRANESYVIWRVGRSAFTMIANMAKTPEIGDPTTYDIEFSRNTTGWAMTRYEQVLSGNDKTIIASIDKTELEALSAKPTQADIDRVNKLGLLI